mgnify:CR=1 FL=1
MIGSRILPGKIEFAVKRLIFITFCRLIVNRLRQPWSTLSQLSAFSLSFMLLALLLVLRGDLLDRWQQQLPPESPNYFLINIATEQVEPLKAFLAEHQIVPESFYPRPPAPPKAACCHPLIRRAAAQPPH